MLPVVVVGVGVVCLVYVTCIFVFGVGVVWLVYITCTLVVGVPKR